MKNLVLRKGLVVFGLILAFVFSLFAVVYGAQSEGENINNDSNRQQQLQNNEQKPRRTKFPNSALMRIQMRNLALT